VRLRYGEQVQGVEAGFECGRAVAIVIIELQVAVPFRSPLAGEVEHVGAASVGAGHQVIVVAEKLSGGKACGLGVHLAHVTGVEQLSDQLQHVLAGEKIKELLQQRRIVAVAVGVWVVVKQAV